MAAKFKMAAMNFDFTANIFKSMSISRRRKKENLFARLISIQVSNVITFLAKLKMAPKIQDGRHEFSLYSQHLQILKYFYNTQPPKHHEFLGLME